MVRAMDEFRQPGEGAGEREVRTVSVLFAILAITATALVIHGAFFGNITALLLRCSFRSLRPRA
jgi:hypothetical protein